MSRECFHYCWADLKQCQVFSAPHSTLVGWGYTRSWERTQLWQLTTSDHRDIPDYMASCSAYRSGERRRKSSSCPLPSFQEQTAPTQLYPWLHPPHGTYLLCHGLLPGYTYWGAPTWPPGVQGALAAARLNRINPCATVLSVAHIHGHRHYGVYWSFLCVLTGHSAFQLVSQ